VQETENSKTEISFNYYKKNLKTKTMF